MLRDPLIIGVTAGVIVRGIILWATRDLSLTIIDEQHYGQIARSLASGHGFAWGPGELTSIRPPLYPGLLAVIWTLLGTESLQAVRFVQIVLSVATMWLVYVLGARVYGVQVGKIAAAAFWLYPSLVFFNFLILTETLFTFLLVSFVLLAVMLVEARPERTPYGLAVACGATLGLAALARSVMWPLPLVLCPLLALLLSGPLVRRLAIPALVLVGFVAVVGPWAVRNTRLQGVTTIVDTMGGMNLRMGNYEHTLEDRMWDTVALTGEKNWVHGINADFPPGHTITEGEKDKWAQAKAIEYMRAHPGVTVRRAFIKFADFWGLEREFIAGVQNGLFNVPFWLAAAIALTIVCGYAAVAVLGAAGLWLSPPANWRAHVLLLLPILLITGIHTLVFGHSRYHMPLVPILLVYGAALLARGFAVSGAKRWVVTGATVTVAALCLIWTRQIVFVDLPRITSALFPD